MCASALWRSCSVIVPLATCRAMLPLTVARPALMRSSLMSCRRTSRPAQAQTWAMPLPICPAPMTPTVLISMPIAVCPTPVADEPIIGHLEDGRVLVLVDGHDDLGVLHAGEMLNSS